MTDTRSLYDEDFVAWTEQQAEALRAAAHGGTNQRLDWENLAEEIESLGKSDRRELHSQIYRIIRHLAKLQFSPTAEPRRGWRESIDDGRKQVELLLADSPSLKRQLQQIIVDETASALRRAVGDLADFGKIDQQAQRSIRQTRYTEAQVLSDWFPPAPTARNDEQGPA